MTKIITTSAPRSAVIHSIGLDRPGHVTTCGRAIGDDWSGEYTECPVGPVSCKSCIKITANDTANESALESRGIKITKPADVLADVIARRVAHIESMVTEYDDDMDNDNDTATRLDLTKIDMSLPKINNDKIDWTKIITDKSCYVEGIVGTVPESAPMIGRWVGMRYGNETHIVADGATVCGASGQYATLAGGWSMDGGEHACATCAAHVEAVVVARERNGMIASHLILKFATKIIDKLHRVDFVTIDAPDDTDGTHQPIFEGNVYEAPGRVAPGVYAGSMVGFDYQTGYDEIVKIILVVTEREAFGHVV